LPRRRQIPINYDISLFEQVLRYFYTNSICFLTPSASCDDPDAPATRDAEGIYKIAAELKIEPLREKTLRFLQASCTLSNISERVLSNFASEYHEVGEVYKAYMLRNWKTVVQMEEYAKAGEPRSDPAESQRIYSTNLALVRLEAKLK